MDQKKIDEIIPIDEDASFDKIQFLKVPLHIVPPEKLEAIVYSLLKDGKGYDIVLLSLWDLLKARGNNEYHSFVQRATMVVPIAKSIVGGVRFLLRRKIHRYMPFDFVINLLSILEKREFSLYLLGGRMRVLKKAEKNLRQTFPRLRIVGRFVGNFKHQEETVILEAVRKSTPSLLLAGKGLKGGERWLARNSAHLNNGLRLWCSDLFEVFAERRRRPGRGVFDRGLEWVGFCFQKPWRFFRIVPYFYYKILLCVYRIFNLS